MMLCPNDHMMMNQGEADGVSVYKCPVCGSVRMAASEEDNAAIGSPAYYPYSAGQDSTGQVNEPAQEAPFGAVAEDAETSAGSGRNEQVAVYGAPDGHDEPPAGASPYGYVPDDVAAAAEGTAAEGYGMPPVEFGRSEQPASEQLMQGGHAYQPLPSKD